MGLSDQQKLYTLPKYYLLLMLGDNEICGIVSQDNAKKINFDDLRKCGFYLEEINFDELYSQGLNILQDENLI